jgi:hypothetical protein
MTPIVHLAVLYCAFVSATASSFLPADEEWSLRDMVVQQQPRKLWEAQRGLALDYLTPEQVEFELAIVTADYLNGLCISNDYDKQNYLSVTLTRKLYDVYLRSPDTFSTSPLVLYLRQPCLQHWENPQAKPTTEQLIQLPSLRDYLERGAIVISGELAESPQSCKEAIDAMEKEFLPLVHDLFPMHTIGHVLLAQRISRLFFTRDLKLRRLGLFSILQVPGGEVHYELMILASVRDDALLLGKLWHFFHHTFLPRCPVNQRPSAGLFALGTAYDPISQMLLPQLSEEEYQWLAWHARVVDIAAVNCLTKRLVVLSNPVMLSYLNAKLSPNLLAQANVQALLADPIGANFVAVFHRLSCHPRKILQFIRYWRHRALAPLASWLLRPSLDSEWFLKATQASWLSNGILAGLHEVRSLSPAMQLVLRDALQRQNLAIVPASLSIPQSQFGIQACRTCDLQLELPWLDVVRSSDVSLVSYTAQGGPSSVTFVNPPQATAMTLHLQIKEDPKDAKGNECSERTKMAVTIEVPASDQPHFPHAALFWYASDEETKNGEDVGSKLGAKKSPFTLQPLPEPVLPHSRAQLTCSLPERLVLPQGASLSPAYYPTLAKEGHPFRALLVISNDVTTLDLLAPNDWLTLSDIDLIATCDILYVTCIVLRPAFIIPPPDAPSNSSSSTNSSHS